MFLTSFRLEFISFSVKRCSWNWMKAHDGWESDEADLKVKFRVFVSRKRLLPIFIGEQRTASVKWMLKSCCGHLDQTFLLLQSRKCFHLKSATCLQYRVWLSSTLVHCIQPVIMELHHLVAWSAIVVKENPMRWHSQQLKSSPSAEELPIRDPENSWSQMRLTNRQIPCA